MEAYNQGLNDARLSIDAVIDALTKTKYWVLFNPLYTAILIAFLMAIILVVINMREPKVIRIAREM